MYPACGKIMFLFVCFYLCLCSALKLIVSIECPEELLAHTKMQLQQFKISSLNWDLLAFFCYRGS